MKMRTAIAILSLPLTVAVRDAAAGTADSLVVPRTDTAPVLDGRLDDPEWQHAVAIPLRPAAGDVRLQPDVVRLLWDAKFLYIGYRTADEDIAATRTTGSTDTCPNTFEGTAQDLMELFLAPEAGGDGWELHHNALGAFTDLRVKPGSGTAPPTLDRQAELPRGEDGLATVAALAPKANGKGTSTVNFPFDRDGGWSGELRVPWSALLPAGQPAAAGFGFRFLAARQLDGGGYRHVLPEAPGTWFANRQAEWPVLRLGDERQEGLRQEGGKP